MLKDFFESVGDSLRHRFGRRHTETRDITTRSEFR